MEARLPILENIRVATPCTASWEQMKGDEKKRFCDQCKLHVHNFSAMTEAEITGLIQNGKGRICGRFFRRADGTMLTKDCPVGLAALRRKVARVLARAAAAVLSAVGIFTFLRSGSSREAGAVTSVTEVEPIKSVCEWISPASGKATLMMGDIIIAPPAQGKGSGR